MRRKKKLARLRAFETKGEIMLLPACPPQAVM